MRNNFTKWVITHFFILLQCIIITNMNPLLKLPGTVIYFEKPVTQDEKSIAHILETIVQSFKNQDVSLLTRVIRDDAKIELIKEQTRAGSAMTKKEYIDKTTSYFNKVHSVQFQDTLIRVKNEQEATASYKRVVLLHNKYSFPRISNGYIKFIKSGKLWLIAEAR